MKTNQAKIKFSLLQNIYQYPASILGYYLSNYFTVYVVIVNIPLEAWFLACIHAYRIELRVVFLFLSLIID